MKIVIIGGVAAGATAATNIRRQSEDVEIILLEKGRDMSFKNCEIPYYLSHIIEDSKDLIARDAETFKKRNNIDARNYSEAIKIDRKNKIVYINDYKNNKKYQESYDKLIIATGASPFVPENIKGLKENRDNIFKVENVVDVENIRAYIENNKSKKILINGAGFIGIETAENIAKLDNVDITIIARSRVLSANIDVELAGFVEENIKEHIKLIKGDEIVQVRDNNVLMKSNSIIDYDVLINAIGIRPNSQIAQQAGLSITENGAIKTDRNFLTSDPDIYAIGDVIEVYNPLSKSLGKLNLAWPAHRQAKFVASHIIGQDGKIPSFIGAFALRSFDMNVASVGLTSKILDQKKIPYKSTLITHLDSVASLPGSKPMHLKILFDKYTGKIYGLQAVGEGDVVKRIDIASALIGMGADIYDLYDTEISYQPLFSTPEDALNVLASQAIDVFERRVKTIELDKLYDNIKDFRIIDIRDEDSFEKSHLKRAENIPSIDFRARIENLNKDEKILIYDQDGSRAKSILKMLQNSGFNYAYMLDGAFEYLEKYVNAKRLDILESKYIYSKMNPYF